MTDVLLVWSNLPDRGSADRLARALVEQRLAACVNVLAEAVSTYRWNGQIETATEIPVLIKTTAGLYSKVEEAIRRLHPYELPEVIALPVSAGLPAYLGWVARETLPVVS